MSNPKILAICAYGHSRSVCLARLFHGMGYSAVSIGFLTSGDALPILADWADYIMIVDGGAIGHIPFEAKLKCRHFDVGPDVWQNPYSKELREKFITLIKDRTPELWKEPK